MHYFDTYPHQSRLRKVHPGAKVCVFVLYIVLCLLSHSLLLSGTMMVVVTAVTAFTARIRLLRLFRLMLIPVGFVLIGILPVMVELNPPHSLFQVSIFGNTWAVTSTGLHQSLLIFLRSFSTIAVLYFLVLNTSVTDLLYVSRKIGIPSVVCDIMVLMYRNIYIFFDTAQNIYTSQKSRLGYRSLKTSLRSTGLLAGRIFVLAGTRAENLLRSMESRCYNGEFNTLPGEWKVNRAFWIISILLAAVFTLALFYTNQYPAI